MLKVCTIKFWEWIAFTEMVPKVISIQFHEDQFLAGVLEFLVNPEIKLKSKKTSFYEEGCLSLPGYFAEIERPAECNVEFIDYFGKKKELKADGLLSTCIQHEIDHLNGVLFIDYLSKLKRDMIIKKLTKQKKSLDKTVL